MIGEASAVCRGGSFTEQVRPMKADRKSSHWGLSEPAPVSLATAEQSIGRAIEISCSPSGRSSRRGPCVASVCCGGLAGCESTAGAGWRWCQARERGESVGDPPQHHPLLLRPFITQSVGSRAAPDTWHTILAPAPDMASGGQV